jgi:hypothetical protein
MRRSGQKLPATTLFGQSEENTDFEPKPHYAKLYYSAKRFGFKKVEAN